MALMPIWLVAVLVIALIASILDAVGQIEKKCLMYCAYAVLVVLYLASLSINWYITIGPYAVIVAGVLGVGLFFFSAVATKFLVKIDVILANFVTTDDSNVHDPDECQDRFELSETTDDGYVLPQTRMTRHVWLAVVYFASFKLVIGMLSTAVLVISVVLPALVLFSGGDASFFVGQITFSDSPIIYTVLTITIWLVGVVGVPVVTVISVKVTLWVCDAGQQQTEVETESAVSVTPTPELTTTNFVAIDP
ncbi:hypothetical protein V7S43_002573 [Phytophthora oleae]|uniref:Uncharacterized protein n=1 Tax=Phytophthora oleae TaxID=2107226 RepID=A0ABD3G1H5_9STRA